MFVGLIELVVVVAMEEMLVVIMNDVFVGEVAVVLFVVVEDVPVALWYTCQWA